MNILKDKKKILIIVVATIVISVVLWFTLSGDKQAQVTTDSVKTATIIDSVSESGNIQARDR